MSPNEPNGRTELEVALLESENARQESESLRELVAKLLAKTPDSGADASE